jgi:hypothetical protein
MKHPGNVNDYTEQRTVELVRAYQKECAAAGTIRWKEIVRRVCESPCSRFWVSEERAAIVISKMERGDDLSYLRKNRREMFREIYSRYLEVKAGRPGISFSEAAFIVVNQPAPRFYLTPLTAYHDIQKYKRRCLKERKNKLRHLLSGVDL